MLGSHFDQDFHGKKLNLIGIRDELNELNRRLGNLENSSVDPPQPIFVSRHVAIARLFGFLFEELQRLLVGERIHRRQCVDHLRIITPCQFLPADHFRHMSDGG